MSTIAHNYSINEINI